jgi:hypothetical protein
MSTKIDELKSKMTTFARPNLFEVIVYPINTTVGSYLERFNGNCFSAQIPGMTTLTTEKDEGYRSIAYQKAYEDVSLGFYVNEDMKEIKFFQDWMKLMIDPKTNHVGFYDDYVGVIDIKTLSRSGTQEKGNRVTMTTTLHDAFPKSLSVVGLDYGANDEIIKIDVTFTYRYYTQTFGERQEPVGQPASNAKAIHRNESDEDFAKRQGLKVPKEFEYKAPKHRLGF